MTKKTLFRHLVALAVLASGDAATYWYLLPKHAKVSLNASYWRLRKMSARVIMRNWLRASQVLPMIKAGGVAPISEREFRIPFRRIA